MARPSKFLFVAALVAMLVMAPVLDARPLVEDSTVAPITHQRQLRTFGILGAKLCFLKTVFTFGIKRCAPKVVPVPVPVPVPTPVVPVHPKPVHPQPEPKYEHKPEPEPISNNYNRKA